MINNITLTSGGEFSTNGGPDSELQDWLSPGRCSVTGIHNWKCLVNKDKLRDSFFGWYLVTFLCLSVPWIITINHFFLPEEVKGLESSDSETIVIILLSVMLLNAVTSIFAGYYLSRHFLLKRVLDFYAENEDNRFAYLKKLKKQISKLAGHRFYMDDAGTGMIYQVKSNSGLKVYIEFEGQVPGEFPFWELVERTRNGESEFRKYMKP